LDINNNNILDEDEINQDASSYICNGEPGIAGEVTRSLQSINCSGPLENLTDLIWTYEIHELTSGDAVVTASIDSPGITVGSLAFYSGRELDAGVEPEASFVFDVLGQKNQGKWRIYLGFDSEVTQTETNILDAINTEMVSNILSKVEYRDSEPDPLLLTWSMPIENCTTTQFE
jgi:hypothetical protein